MLPRLSSGTSVISFESIWYLEFILASGWIWASYPSPTSSWNCLDVSYQSSLCFLTALKSFNLKVNMSHGPLGWAVQWDHSGEQITILDPGWTQDGEPCWSSRPSIWMLNTWEYFSCSQRTMLSLHFWGCGKLLYHEDLNVQWLRQDRFFSSRLTIPM